MVKKKKEETRIKKPFITTAIALIVVVLFTFFSALLNSAGFSKVSSLFSIFVFAGIILVFVGFYSLGKKYEHKLLMRTVIAGFALYIALFIFISYASQGYQEKVSSLNETLSGRIANLEQLKMENASTEVIASFESETTKYLIEEGLPLLIPFLLGYLVLAIYLTFFGVGMIRLRKVEYSKTIGVLIIVSVWLVPTIIGIFLALPLSIAIYVLVVMMFSNESKKAKE